MRRAFLLAIATWCGISIGRGQQPRGPWPQGVNPPVSQGDDVWRFDRTGGPAPAPNPAPFGRSIAFLVGVDSYRHLDPLNHTATDVRNIRDFLLGPGGFDTVFEVQGDKVNGTLLNTWMLNRFSRSDSKYLTGKDRFLFYYSGHAGSQGDLGYLLFSNANPSDGDYVTDALGMEAVRNWAYVSVARQVLMILDTCDSGFAIQAGGLTPARGLGDDPGGILLTAGTGNQEAYQAGNNQQGYGVFTHALLEALKAGVSGQTPFMGIFEAYGRARAAVHEFELTRHITMTPNIDHTLKRRGYATTGGNFVFLNSNAVQKNSVSQNQSVNRPVRKEAVANNLPPVERPRAANTTEIPIAVKAPDKEPVRNDLPSVGRPRAAITTENPIAAKALDLAVLNGMVKSVEFSPQGDRVVTSEDGYDTRAFLGDVTSGRLLATFTGHTKQVRSAVFSPDGKQVVTASDDKTARVWDAGSGHVLAILTGHTKQVRSAVFSPDGRRVVTASDDKTARIWDARSGQLLSTFEGHTNRVQSAVFSPDGRRVLTAGDDKTARVWDSESGRVLAVLNHGSPIWISAFSPDGTRVMTAGPGAVRLWDANNGAALPDFIAEGLSAPAAFSPDGKRVVAAHRDYETFTSTFRVLEAASGRVLATLDGHKNAIGFSSTLGIANDGTKTTAMFSPDSKRVVTASDDRTALVWDAESGHVLAILTGHSDNVRTVAFSQDGAHVVTTDAGNYVRMFEAPSVAP